MREWQINNETTSKFRLERQIYMKAEDYIRSFVNENDAKYSIYEGYSGKNMFGRKCLGVIIKQGNSCMEFMMDLTTYITQKSADDEDFDLGFSEGMCTDDFGKDSIVYFPTIQG